MNEFEKVVRNFRLFTENNDHPIPVTYNPEKFLNVYDKEEDYAPARIIYITKDPDGIAIEVKYIKDDTTRCYLLSDETDIDLPKNDQPHNYRYKEASSFDYLFITENQISKFKEKVWPNRFDGFDDIYLEYIKTIDANHSNYKFIWYDGFDRENEFIVTLSREDINELLDDAEEFINKLQDAIIIMGLWTSPLEEE
jgi:hypothetical protein